VIAPDIFAIIFSWFKYVISAGETDVCRPNTKMTQCADIGLGCIGLQSSKHLEDRINVVFVFPLAHFHVLQGATRRTEHGG
jgi:hypothetical protein